MGQQESTFEYENERMKIKVKELENNEETDIKQIQKVGKLGVENSKMGQQERTFEYENERMKTKKKTSRQVYESKEKIYELKIMRRMNTNKTKYSEELNTEITQRV